MTAPRARTAVEILAEQWGTSFFSEEDFAQSILAALASEGFAQWCCGGCLYPEKPHKCNHLTSDIGGVCGPVIVVPVDTGEGHE